MNVLIVSNKYRPDVVGGAELVADSLARALARAAHTVTVLTTRTTPGEPESEEQESVTIHRIWPGSDFLPRPGLPWWRHVLHQSRAHLLDLHNRRVARATRERIDATVPDLVHTHNLYGLSPSVWTAAAEAGIPIVHTAHDCYLLCPRGTLLHGNGRPCDRAPALCRLYRSWYLRQARAVTAFCCPSLHHLDLHRRRGIGARSCHLIHNGIEGVPGQTPPKPTAAGRSLRVLYLGRLESHKGIDTLLRAADLVQEQATFAIAGTGPLAGRVRDAAERCDRIRHHGFVSGSAKERLLNDADILVLPSVCAESYGMSVVEGFAHAVPAVVTNIGGQAELVDDGVTGHHFPPGDAERLAAIIRDLAAAPARLSIMRRAAFEASRAFTLERMAQTYMDLYREVISDRHPDSAVI